jgi:DNA-binding beta-propeller fold protein YncE
MVTLVSVCPNWREQSFKLAVVAMFALAGCSGLGPASVSNSSARQQLLQPWIDLTGSRSISQFGQPGLAVSGGYIVLRQPTAISARANDLYFIDAGLHRIFRYNRVEQTLTPFSNLAAEAVMSIYTAPDMSVYITDPVRAQVLHFSPNGSPLPSLVSPGNLGRPIAIAIDESSGQLLVADALYNQIIVFNYQGQALSIIKPQQVRGIAAMALGTDGIYILDKLARQIVVMRFDGTYRYAFGADALTAPAAITVSRDNLVFVSDHSDQTIKVFRNGQLLSTAGGTGIAPGRFNQIAGMAVEGGLFYAADSLNARVQIMFINTHALDTRKGE